MTPLQAYLFGLSNGVVMGVSVIALAWIFL